MENSMRNAAENKTAKRKRDTQKALKALTIREKNREARKKAEDGKPRKKAEGGKLSRAEFIVRRIKKLACIFREDGVK